MTMLDIHADALNRSNVVYHEFLIRYKATAKVVYGIVEGKEDPMFYRGFIEHNLAEGWEVELFLAGCKDKVLSELDAFDWARFSPKRVCFFVDRDLSDFVSKIEVSATNVYITDNYSIENNVVSSSVFKRLLTEVLNFSDLTQTELDIIEQHFSSSLSFFQEAMTPIMAQVILWQRNNKNSCLDNINPKDLFFFEDGNIKIKNEFQSKIERLNYASARVKLPLSSEIELSRVENEFRERCGPQKFVRGKYILWFLIEFAQEMYRSITLYISRLIKKPKPRLSIGLKNAMVILAPRVRCPASLQSFLIRNYGEYVKNMSVC